MLISPLNAFPWVLNGLVEAWVSLKRVQSFLLLPELYVHQYYTIEGEGEGESKEMVTINGGTFTWKREEEENGWTLDGIDITLMKVRERGGEREKRDIFLN